MLLQLKLLSCDFLASLEFTGFYARTSFHIYIFAVEGFNDDKFTSYRIEAAYL